MLQARQLLQAVGLGSKKGVSDPLCQDTEEGEVTVFIYFETLGHLSFLSQTVSYCVQLYNLFVLVNRTL